MDNHTWVTPDPKKVKRFIALPPEGLRSNWVEVYIGERLLVNRSRLFLLLSKGFIESDKPKVYKTMQEAENED